MKIIITSLLLLFCSYVYAQNVGIGTANPVSKLHIFENGPTTLTIEGSSVGYMNAGLVLKATSGIDRRGLGVFMYDNGGQTEWYSGRPYGSSDAFVIHRRTGFTSHNDETAGIINGLGIPTGTNRYFVIDNSGNTGIGLFNTVSPTAKLSVNGTANKPGGGSWAVFSDIRLKKNINSYEDGLSTLLQIECKTFQYNGKAGIQDTETEYVGILAQDIQKIAPYMVREIDCNDLVTTDKNTYLEFDPSAMDFMIVNAIKS